jgi:release factor glutamine methyltransferase
MNKRLPKKKFSPSDPESWKQAIFDMYAKMRAKAKEPYEIECGGLTLTVLPNVYAPEFFEDSLWYAQQLQKIVGKKSLLEIGTGTGVIAIFCAKNGAHVVATDINPTAVENARINVKRYMLDLSVREGDVYDPVELTEKFDFIFWSHPFNHWDLKADDMLFRSSIDPNYIGLKKYIADAKDHLTPTGKLLLGTKDSADLKKIERIAKQNGYDLNLLGEAVHPLAFSIDNKIKDLIYELVPLKKS